MCERVRPGFTRRNAFASQRYVRFFIDCFTDPWLIATCAASYVSDLQTHGRGVPGPRRGPPAPRPGRTAATPAARVLSSSGGGPAAAAPEEPARRGGRPEPARDRDGAHQQEAMKHIILAGGLLWARDPPSSPKVCLEPCATHSSPPAGALLLAPPCLSRSPSSRRHPPSRIFAAWPRGDPWPAPRR